MQDIIDEIVMGGMAKYLDDPHVGFNLLEISEANKIRRDNAWKVIRSLVEQEPDIYDKDKRGPLVQQAMVLHKVTHKTVYKYLKKYWQRGKTPDALLPDYHKSGGKGKEKSVGPTKRGRPPIYGVAGINVDEATKKIFRTAVEKYFLTTKKNNLSDAYKMMIKEFYSEGVYYENRRERIVIADQNKLPTIAQFRYWYQKEYGVETTLVARVGGRKFEKDHRAVLGSSTLEADGPGARFQIDATVADVYLISRYNPDWIIGRPVLYLVVDVYSRMIVGMYVGLEGPSWMGAMMALSNAASDKSVYCAQYGIEVPESAWPCKHLPKVLLADRGELEGYNIERLVNAFQLHVENAAPYRADWKGIVEKQFDTIQKKVKPFLPGYVEKDFQERGARDYRLDAKLTLEQFTQIMIRQILKYNTTHYLESYVRDEEMIRDGVEPVPLKLWNWGIENRSGTLRYFPENLIRSHLLPQDSAIITHKGIKFKQMLYGSERAIREGWFAEARHKGSWKVSISYDPRNVSTVYLWHEGTGSFEPCQLLDHQERYMNKTLDEVQNLIAHEKRMRQAAQHPELQAEVNFYADVEDIVKSAVKETRGKQTTSSKSKRIKDIKNHRRMEREERRKEEAFVETNPTVKPPADVIPFTPKTIEVQNLPSIKEFLRRQKEQNENE